MNRPCRAPGCRVAASSRFAAHCPRHKAALRRHGDAEQRSITKGMLTPYLRMAKNRIDKNSKNSAWATLEARWSALVAHAEAIVAAYEAGRPSIRHERIAAFEIIKLARNVEPRRLLEVTSALVLMRELEPHYFKSDRSFWVQLSRRVRAEANVSFGERWDHRTGRVRRMYRDLSPRAAIIVGRWLASTLGVAGLHFARLEKTQREVELLEREQLSKSFSQLV